MTAAPADRSFAIFRLGELKQQQLRYFRNRLRLLINTATGVPFTEQEIGIATAKFTRWDTDAEATDLLLLAQQARALTLVDQLRPERANTDFLRNFHARRLEITPRPAFGGSGPVLVAATPGSTLVGSTTIGDPIAHVATDDAKLRYQVLYDVTIDGSGFGEVQFVGIDTGTATNLIAGAKLRPANGPIGWTIPGEVISDFRGGVPAESDPTLARRITWQYAHKQASGNSAHFRGWAEDDVGAVEAAFVYPSALEAGTTLVAITQARGNIRGPLGRVPSVGTLAAVRAKITPPGSSVVPAHPSVLVTGFTGEPCDMVLRFAMPRSSSAGWAALDPWPGTDVDGTPVTITTLTTQTNFRITISADSMPLPAGVTQPPLMAWNALTSTFEILQVQSVVLFAGDVYTVTLSGAPQTTLAVGSYISPATEQHDAIEQTIEAYFDTLGPGEVVDLETSLVGSRAQRFPLPTEEYPQRAGTVIESMLDDALGSALGDRDLPYVSDPLPDVPADPALGPSMLVAGRIGVYPL